jgi:hypothetical protein
LNLPEAISSHEADLADFDHRLAPLTVILTPATLTVEQSILTNVTTCPSVRTLNFTPETVNDWRKPKKILGRYELSLSFWNTTNTTNTNPNDPNFFDYYTGPSQPIQQVATLSAYLQRTVGRENASVDICGAGWNCSFTISFTGPGYKCSNGTSDLGSHAKGPIAMRKQVFRFLFSYIRQNQELDLECLAHFGTFTES